jgi:hypothetical protein
MRRRVRAAITLAMTVALMLGGGAAMAQTQPSQVNADERNGGATTPGPHCHFVLPAGDNAAFEDIITGAIHEAHITTGTPTGIFEATACPT